jgi:hypothetical protein
MSRTHQEITAVWGQVKQPAFGAQQVVVYNLKSSGAKVVRPGGME